MWILALAIVLTLSLPVAWLVHEEFEVAEWPRVGNAMLMAGALLLFVALYPFLDFLLAGFISLVVITRWCAKESWQNTVILSAATPIVLFLLFGVAFSVPLQPLPFVN